VSRSGHPLPVCSDGNCQLAVNTSDWLRTKTHGSLVSLIAYAIIFSTFNFRRMPLKAGCSQHEQLGKPVNLHLVGQWVNFLHLAGQWVNLRLPKFCPEWRNFLVCCLSSRCICAFGNSKPVNDTPYRHL